MIPHVFNLTRILPDRPACSSDYPATSSFPNYLATRDIRENTYMSHEFIRARIHEKHVFGGSLIFSPARLSITTQSHMNAFVLFKWCVYVFKIYTA